MLTTLQDAAAKLTGKISNYDKFGPSRISAKREAKMFHTAVLATWPQECTSKSALYTSVTAHSATFNKANPNHMSSYCLCMEKDQLFGPVFLISLRNCCCHGTPSMKSREGTEWPLINVPNLTLWQLALDPIVQQLLK